MSLWNDLADPIFDGVILTDLKSRAKAFYWHKLLAPFLCLMFSLSLLSFYRFICVAEVFGLIVC